MKGAVLRAKELVTRTTVVLLHRRQKKGSILAILAVPTSVFAHMAFEITTESEVPVRPYIAVVTTLSDIAYTCLATCSLFQINHMQAVAILAKLLVTTATLVGASIMAFAFTAVELGS